MPHDTDDVQTQKLLTQDPNRPWYRIENAAKTGEKTRAKVHIFDAIGGWFGVRAKDLVKEINDLDVDEIELRLNSPGGQVWDGIAIMNALRSHRATVEVHVDGIAASIASVIAMGGDQIIMSRGAQMMIHCGSTITWGNAADLRKSLVMLDKTDANMAGIYAARAGGEAADWLALMENETWYNAAEAVDAGLADIAEDSDIGDDEDTSEDAAAQFDLSIYHHAGRSKAPAPLSARDIAHARATYTAEGFPALMRMATAGATHKPPAEPGPPTNRKESAMTDTLKAGISERLGITDAETDDAAILAALDERLTAQSTTQPPAGTMLIEEGVYNQMRADAAAGREAREQQITERRDGIIATAMREGRISAHSAPSFRAQLDTDEAGTVAILNSLPEEAVPVSELGTSSADDSIDAEYSRYYPTSKEA